VIIIEISVAPHYANTHYTKESMRTPGMAWEQTPDSHPPHVIIEKNFETWRAAYAWVSAMDLKSDSGSLDDLLLELMWDSARGKPNQYVQVEIELLERTGTEYTCACIAIEGDEEGRPQPDRVASEAE